MSISTFPRRTHACWLATAVLLACMGCDATPRPVDSTAANGSAAQDKGNSSGLERVTLMLNWYPEAEHGGFFAAKVHGLYQQSGLEVEIRPGGENAPVAQELLTGRIQFAIGNADDVLLFRQQGADIVALFAPIQQTPRCIMVRSQSGIASLTQLKGLTLQANKGQAFLSFMESRGMLEGVQLVPYSGSVARFVAEDKTAIQAYSFSEPQLAEEKGVPVKVLMLSEIGFNPYASCLLATRSYVEQHPEQVARMVDACRAGWQKYLAEPADSNAAILAVNPERMTREALAYGAAALKTLCEPTADETAQFGGMSLKRWEKLVEQFIELKLITPDKVTASAAYMDVAKSTATSASNQAPAQP